MPRESTQPSLWPHLDAADARVATPRTVTRRRSARRRARRATFTCVLWPDVIAFQFVNAPGRPHALPRVTLRVRHLADALTRLDLPAAAANLRALAYPARDAVPPAWVRWGLGDRDGLTSKGARVLERIARLQGAGITANDLMEPDGLGVLRDAWNLVALRAAPCPHPAAWCRDGLVTRDRALTDKGHAVLNALEGLARDLDVPFGSLD